MSKTYGRCTSVAKIVDDINKAKNGDDLYFVFPYQRRSDFQSEDAAAVAVALRGRNFNKLTLRLAYNLFCPAKMGVICELIIKTCAKICVDFSCVDCSELCDEMLCSALAKSTSVQAIILFGSFNLERFSNKFIFEALKLKTLTTLYLSNTCVCNNDFEKIMNALKKNTTILTLTISFNDMNLYHFQTINDMLKENTYLLSLRLHNDAVYHEHLQLFEELISDNHLYQLELIDFKMTSEDLSLISNLIARSRTPRSLNLGCNDIDSKGMCLIANALATNTALEELYLYGNDIDSAFLQALANSLRVNKTLTSLEFDGTTPFIEGYKELYAALKENTTVQSINGDLYSEE